MEIGPSRTVPEWCAHRRVSRAMFYKLDAQGFAPATYYVGTSRRVSPEADAAWLRAREEESKQRNENADATAA